MEFVLLLVGIITGVVIGWIISTQQKTVGTIRVDYTDPDGPYMFLELLRDVNDVTSKKKVYLDIRIRD